MTLQITCKQCGCTFDISSEQMPKKTGICCPNCEAKFSDAPFKKLQEACSAFNEATKMIPRQSISGSSFPAFTLSIKEN